MIQIPKSTFLLTLMNVVGVKNMVEPTRKNHQNLLIGEYSKPGTKLRPRESDILLITAGQPLDFPFSNWIQRSQLNKTEYQPYDANFPLKIPRREFFKAGYSVDPPLSQFGQHFSRVIGRQLVDFKFHPSCIYTCPSLKCLETSALISSSFKRDAPGICVEYGLWGEYVKIDAGLLISPEDAANQIEFPIKRGYQPFISLNQVDKCSTWNEWQNRCVSTFKKILEKEKNHGKFWMVTVTVLLCVLFLAIFILDPLAMKTITAFCIYGKNFGFNSDEDFLNLSNIPFGASLLIERSSEGKFLLPENYFPSYTTSTFSTKFDFDKLDEEVIVLAE